MSFILGTARSSFFFTNLKQLYSTWDETKLALQVASMPCLLAFIRAGNFSEGMRFVNLISGLEGNVIKNRKMYLILKTQTIEQNLLHNKTIHFNVHIIHEGKHVMFTTCLGITPSCFILKMVG